MKLSKSILQAVLIAVTTGAIVSCEKLRKDELSKPKIHKSKTDSTLVSCPACGMG
ncbi:MAG: hypothetical protein ABJA90_03040 [Ginsengibacter sp.]